MRRMLIVDDEPLIADGLYTYFAKADIEDMEILKVYSAKQALEWLDTVKVDIVLSDICMPGMDGMQLIQEIVDRWPRCKVILLTGHNEFEYAHQAIRNPCVADYLLKTEGMEKIRETVEQTLKQIARENDFRYQAEWFQEKMPKALPQLQRQLLLDLLKRRGAKAWMNLQEEFDAIRLPFRAELAVLPMLLRIEEWGSYESQSDQRLLCYAAANIAEELLGDKAAVKVAELDSRSLVCYIQPHAGQLQQHGLEQGWERTIRFVMGTLESIQQSCRDCLRLSVSIIAANQAVQWGGLQQSVNRLGLAVFDSPGYGMEKLMRLDITGETAGLSLRQDKLAAAELLLEHMKQRLLEGSDDWMCSFRQWVEITGEGGPDDPFLRLRLLHGIADMSLRTVQEAGLSEEAGREHDLAPMLHFNIHTRWSDIIAFYRETCQWIVLRRRDSCRHDESHILMNIHHYIKQHLDGDLSLTRIAQEVSLNPSYLSRWYKKVTGRGISDYILERRVEKSKELLLGTTLRMQDISGQLGFSDQHYFFRFFKKAVGCTPQEYRDQRKGAAETKM
ncbi:response regulator [Paenibacillus tarimensis]|uniref:response regulator n=1 Tax=Paenibacillus tarimensis TaxID=416012 RepID=UPI001F3E6A21|nr:response regulator [Paenibacillus tarimensis]MCF2945475.1 response regulator [Paenibacillus tarimensis]